MLVLAQLKVTVINTVSEQTHKSAHLGKRSSQAGRQSASLGWAGSVTSMWPGWGSGTGGVIR